MSAADRGKYNIPDEEYDTFLGHVHSHIFGRTPMASSLLEKHNEAGPLLVDLDMRYETGGPLVRRFTTTHIRSFIAEYVAAMVYFSKIESLPQDLEFFHLEKPAPETDKSSHKDGVHIHCPTITTMPRYQYCIRGFLLARGAIDKVFGATGQSNPPEDCYDVSVIHRNNWFLYGACKPDKAQYKIAKVWRVPIADIRDALDGGDPTDFEELVEIVSDLMTESTIPTNTLEIMKLLSIRRGHKTTTPLGIRNIRATEWEMLMSAWGLGSAKLNKPTHVPKNTIEHIENENQLIVTDVDAARVTDATSDDDVALAYRLCRDCIDAEKRIGEYHDWIRFGICLKNIANTPESLQVWKDLTRKVDSSHKKSKYTDAQMEEKWALIRIDSSKKLGMGSLQYWAREDSPKTYESIISENLTRWILTYGKGTHVSVATFVCRKYRHEFRCSPASNKAGIEWYQYPQRAGSHTWRKMRTPTELRSRLSADVKKEYWEAEKQVGDKLIEVNDKTKRELEEIHRNILSSIEKSMEAADMHDKEKMLRKAAEAFDKSTDNNTSVSKSKKDRGEPELKKDMLNAIVKSLETTSFKDNVLRECQEMFYDEEFMNHLNTNPYLVGVANGVLDLKHFTSDSLSGRPQVLFRDGIPDDNISFQMGRSGSDTDPINYVVYDPESPEQKTLAEFFQKIYPDPVLRHYVLTLLSSCLEGANKEQKFYVMQGPGSNGKSMIELLMELTFGDYGTSVATTIFTRSKPDSGAANPDVMTVKCCRYLHCGEPDDGQKINTSIMKQWTGGDLIQARALFSEQDKFRITGKIFMSCNDLPPISKMDGGTWRRIRVIPHVSTFKDPGDPLINPAMHIYEKDLSLEIKLRQLRTAFLSLLVHYYDTYYLAHGLKEPDCVTQASSKYKEENDIFMTFFNENFVKQAGAGPISGMDVKKKWRDWKKANGRLIDIKEHQVLERMKETCGSGSSDKEFWGVREAEETDLSGASLGTNLLLPVA